MVISQKGKLISFHSIQLTDTHRRYSITERDLPRVVETLKEFGILLLGQGLRIYTDNKSYM